MEILILVLHVVAALGIVGLVLLQHGKGADAGAAFGSGASGSVFGSTGSANFLSRATATLAAVFFLTSLGLTYFFGHQVRKRQGSDGQGTAGRARQEVAAGTDPADRSGGAGTGCGARIARARQGCGVKGTGRTKVDEAWMVDGGSNPLILRATSH